MDSALLVTRSITHQFIIILAFLDPLKVATCKSFPWKGYGEWNIMLWQMGCLVFEVGLVVVLLKLPHFPWTALLEMI